MKNLQEITADIFASMPAETRFSTADAAAIRNHKILLSGLEDGITQGFYDTLYAHPKTYEILKGENRAMREAVLRDWWQKTINSDFDDSYWEWQVFVGLVHIKHNVSNAMMIAMWGWLLKTLQAALKKQLPQDEVEILMSAFEKLAVTIQALTAESFLANYVEALESATGFNGKLINRMVSLQLDGMIQKNKFSMGWTGGLCRRDELPAVSAP